MFNPKKLIISFLAMSSLTQAAEIKVGPTHPIANGYLGTNVESAYSGSGRFLWTDSETLNAVQTLNLQSLRFPGGAAGNFWDWKAGTGFLKFATARDSRNDTLEAFAQLSKKAGGPPVFNINVMTYNNDLGKTSQAMAMVQQQIAMLKAAKNLGLPIQYIELGNEFYLTEKRYSERFPTGEAYANEMVIWARELKSAFPDAKIAAVGDYAAKWRTWNSSLLPHLSGVDAVTVHRYDGLNGGDPVTLLADVFKKWANFQKDAISLFSGKGLSVWMTEFDMSDRTKDHSLASTWLHGIYDAEILIQFLTEPAISLVDIYNLHSDNVTAPLIYTGREVFGPNQIKAESGALSASGHVIKLFGEALKGAQSVGALDLSSYGSVSPDGNHSGFSPYPALTGVALNYEKNSASSSMLIVNLSSKPITLHSGQGPATLETIAAPSLSTNIVTKSSLTSTPVKVNTENVNLPAYSVNFIKKTK